MFHVNPLVILLSGIACCCDPGVGDSKFQPTWASLRTRSMPPWYDDSKVGILVHMGVYSVPAYVSEWFWWFWQGNGPPVEASVKEYVGALYPSSWTYADFARDFTAEFFNPGEWAALFRESGAKYVVLTAKHHEGFALWPSDYSPNWNAMQVGPKRDLVQDLAAAVRAVKLKFGVYYSLYEWFNPLWLEDKRNGFTTFAYSQFKAQVELRDLVVRYNPDIIWTDGDFAPDTYWNSTYFLAWLYNDKANVVVNDRWGFGTSCRHGGFYTCGNSSDPDFNHGHKFENAFSLDKVSWGYRRALDLHCVRTIEEILFEIVSTVARNGNVLINIGARSDGTIPTIFQERLKQMGEWFKINSEAIYGTKPWVTVRDDLNPDVWFTKKPSMIYAFMTKWPGEQINDINYLSIGSLNETSVPRVSQVWMLSTPPILLEHSFSEQGFTIELPCFAHDSPAKWVWVIKILH